MHEGVINVNPFGLGAACTRLHSTTSDMHDEMSTCCGLLPRSLLSESIFVHRGQVIDATAQLIFFSPPPRLRCAVMTTSASFDSQRCRPSHMAIVMYFQHDRAQERPREPQNQPGHDLAPANLPPYLGCRTFQFIQKMFVRVHCDPAPGENKLCPSALRGDTQFKG